MDRLANNDKVVDCDLLNPALNGECAAATGTAPNFGRLGAATQVDPSVLSGWGVRPNDYQYTVTLQHELLPRVSADVSYTHRSFHGFFVTDDLNRRRERRLVLRNLHADGAAGFAAGGWRRLSGHGVRPDGGGATPSRRGSS